MNAKTRRFLPIISVMLVFGLVLEPIANVYAASTTLWGRQPGWNSDPIATNQTAKVQVDSSQQAYFGSSVALAGDILVVGAKFTSVGDNFRQGVAYLFERDQGGANQWGEVRKITASDGRLGDYFGVSVAVSGDTVAVGATGADVGINPGQGAVYIFARNQGGANQWGQVKKFTSEYNGMGASVVLVGDTLAIGNIYASLSTYRQGAVYVFERNQGGDNQWGELKSITGSGSAPLDYFGGSLAFVGDLLVIGALGADVGTNKDQGAAYLFAPNPGVPNQWREVEKLLASDGQAGDHFGSSVVLVGDTLVIGGASASAQDNANQGVVYIFERHQAGASQWAQVAKLTADDGAAGDLFGCCLTLTESLLVVGAIGADVAGRLDQGAAYLFERKPGVANQWTQVKKLTASDGATLDYFGNSLTLAGDMLAVRAVGANIGPIVDQGAVYLYERNQGGANQWGQVKKLVANNGTVGSALGLSMTMVGDDLVVGAGGSDGGQRTGQGAVYLFERNQGGANQWGEVQQITASDGAPGDQFGSSVSMAGDTLLIGAARANVGDNVDQGSAYLFVRNQAGINPWGEGKKLSTSDGGARDNFGSTVAIMGDTLVVGAQRAIAGYGAGNEGAVYLFAIHNRAPGVGEQTFAIAENSAKQTLVGTVVASDADGGQSISFAISGGNANDAFVIDGSSGQLFVNNSSALDFEERPTIPLVVTVSDNGAPPLSSSATILVVLLDVKEPPPPGPNLQIAKLANTRHAKVGDMITYTYQITNSGGQALSIRAVDDKLGELAPVVLPGGAAPLPNLQLQPGQSAVVTKTYTVQNSDLPGPLVNTLVVTGTPPTSGNIVKQTQRRVFLGASPLGAIYLPLVLVTKPQALVPLGELIAERPIATPGEIFRSAQIVMPGAIPATGRFYLSARPDKLMPIRAWFKIIIILLYTC
jgi:hypothetical protein